MSTPILEPYAARQRWEARGPLPGEAWQALMADYLAALARACDGTGRCIIGHIKGLALFDDGSYLRLSAVSATQEPTVDGHVPDGLSAISLTLNVLVYGLSAAELRELTWATAATLARERSLATVVEEAPCDHSAHRPAEEHLHSVKDCTQNSHRGGCQMGKELVIAMADLDEEKVQELVQEGLAQGVSPHDLLDDCREGIGLVGKRFETGEYYLSDLIMAGEVFKTAAAVLTAQMGDAGGPAKGKVVMGTVKGDIHDIGKDIVVTMLRGAGYEVTDLGVDVPPENFVEAARETGAPVVGMSGLLTISFDPMKETVAALKAAGLPVKTMIGGGSLTESVCRYVGADAFGANAQSAVALADGWIRA